MSIELVEDDITAHSILQAAAGHMQARASTYDKPEGERSMAKTVEVFNCYHGTSLTEAQGWHFMQILKDVRLFTREGFHQDSAEDGVAYAALKSEAKAAEDTTRVLPQVANPTPENIDIDDLDKSGFGDWITTRPPYLRPIELRLNTIVAYETASQKVGVGNAGGVVWGGPDPVVRYRIKRT